MDGWNADVKAGAIVGYLCPDCQTAEENAEAEINEATLDYGRDGNGRPIAVQKGHPGAFITGPGGAFATTCSRCHASGTGTGLVTTGEPEWHLAFARSLGIPHDEAMAMLGAYTGAEPGMVIDGWYSVQWRVCAGCVQQAKPNFPQPVPLVPGAVLPGIEQLAPA